MKKKLYTAIGLMSGTSMDGIDLSIISSDGYDEFSNILDNYYEYDKNLQDQLVRLRDLVLTKKDLLQNSEKLRELERNLTLFHADAVNQTLKKYKYPIDLIGFHGQTIFHNPNEKITNQLGDGKLLSQMVKKKVIYDFRQADIQNNGQGAPLTPIFHHILSKKINQNFNIKFPIGFLNIGGIANVTKVINDSDNFQNNLSAFDIGPGNCLIDEWVRNNSNKKFDKNGELADAGKVDQLILNQAIDNFKINSYFQSLDIKNFDVSFARGLSLEDGCATITDFTAYLIAEGLKYISQKNSIKFLICGGGRKNSNLIYCIKKYISNENNITLEIIDNYNLNGDYIESQAFGFLAIRSFLNLPISFSATTGCTEFTVGGKLVENF
ncbi:anhydro-N-acetylmuramic acid kinase [Candidatus Pelagibacter sp.]|uniref:anhydro-N-acetylmuramic acid kinase n=1 Tax=Candidatus Pelagibacter sp. TaxID=2024849 RepID=UPI003F8583D6